jgi:hypothetical protein
MRRFLASCAGLALCAHALAFDPGQFQAVTFKGFQRHQAEPAKGRESILDAAMPGLAVVVTYTGNARPIGTARTEFLKQVGASLGNPSITALYRKEIEVVEQGRSYWLPVQSAVFPHLAKQLRPGQEFTVYARYLGASVTSPERLYLMIEFDAGPVRHLPRTGCFTRRLFGITLGQPIAPVLQDLEGRYGQAKVLSRGQQTHYLFVVDREAETYVIVGDAGAGYRGRVFSVQYTGRPAARPALHESLRLGSSPGQVESVLGKPATRKESGEGYTRLTFPNSACSVELRHGVLASVLILDDPNYFGD